MNDSSAASLADAIHDAIASYLSANEGGIMTNFVFVGEVIDAEGDNVTLVVEAPSASTASSLGLSQYALNFYTESQRRDVIHAIYSDLEDDDD